MSYAEGMHDRNRLRRAERELWEAAHRLGNVVDILAWRGWDVTALRNVEQLLRDEAARVRREWRA